MKRRTFIKQTSLGAAGIMVPKLGYSSLDKDLVVGHGEFKYKVDLNWGDLNRKRYPIKDAHEMVLDKKGRLYLLTNHVKNNVLVYDASGKLSNSWGDAYPGAHGLTIKDEGGTEYLYLTDTERNVVVKTTLDGREILRISYPSELVQYTRPDQFKPTETAVADNGDIYVADGYGMQHILKYSEEGKLLNAFAGRGQTHNLLDNAHGICIDDRNPKDVHLLVTDRMRNQVKIFEMSGVYREKIDLPGAYICRPVIKGDEVYFATIWSGDGGDGTGFVSILNKDNKLISAPGGSAPIYEGGKLKKMHQALKLFVHPHDVCVDRDDNLVVCQWNANGVYPIKLMRV